MLLGVVYQALPVVCAGEKTRIGIITASSRWFRAFPNEFDLTITARPRLFGFLVFKAGGNNVRNGTKNAVMAPFKSLVFERERTVTQDVE